MTNLMHKIRRNNCRCEKISSVANGLHLTSPRALNATISRTPDDVALSNIATQTRSATDR